MSGEGKPSASGSGETDLFRDVFFPRFRKSFFEIFQNILEAEQCSNGGCDDDIAKSPSPCPQDLDAGSPDLHIQGGFLLESEELIKLLKVDIKLVSPEILIDIIARVTELFRIHAIGHIDRDDLEYFRNVYSTLLLEYGDQLAMQDAVRQLIDALDGAYSLPEEFSRTNIDHDLVDSAVESVLSERNNNQEDARSRKKQEDILTVEIANIGSISDTLRRMTVSEGNSVSFAFDDDDESFERSISLDAVPMAALAAAALLSGATHIGGSH